MANTTSYGMGQLRYSNNSTYMSSCNLDWKAVNVYVSSDNQQDVYQDIVLYHSTDTNFKFNMGTAYLLKISIPKDLNYNITYQIKLIAASGNQTPDPLNPDTVTYQMLKYINVPKDTNVGSASRVIIYPTYNGQIGIGNNGSYETQVAIVLDRDSTPEELGQIYYDENNDKYYIYVEDQEGEDIVPQEIEDKNDTILNHTWSSQHSKSKADFSFIFTPRDPDVTYNQIWIEILRESYDQNIKSNGIYGRKIDLDSGLFQANVYELKNLLGANSEISDVTTLNHIGVYSHPNTIMAINGEEIRVGQSGYYELNDFKITSLGIAVDNDNNNDNKFIIDYQYQAATS